MIEEIPNNIDAIAKFLHTAGWTFGWCHIEEKGREVWLVDASKG
jgi:hypothetical protein